MKQQEGCKNGDDNLPPDYHPPDDDDFSDVRDDEMMCTSGIMCAIKHNIILFVPNQIYTNLLNIL